MTLLCILLAAVILGYGLTWIPAARPLVEPRTARYDSRGEGGAAPAAGIPKIIWSYWHSGQPPRVVRACLDNWARFNPGYSVHLVSAASLHEYVDGADLPERFGQATPARQSDWLRLYFLRRYGGIWLDASIILTRSLDWMLEAQALEQADYVGFYLEKYTARPDRPVMDSWCMAAPASSVFVSDWFAEFVQGSFETGDEAYLAQLEAEGQAEAVLQKIDSPGYMMIHVTGQRVLHRGGAYRLHLLRAEDTAYFYQAMGNWRWKRLGLFLNLLVLKYPQRVPSLIKLRGGERRKLEPYLQKRCYSGRSIVGQVLSP